MKDKKITLDFGHEKIIVHGNTIRHNFFGRQKPDTVRRESPEFFAAVETMTTMILAQHQRGIDVATPEYRKDLIETIDFITNQFGDD